MLYLHNVPFVCDNGMAECSTFHIHAELVMLGCVGGHRFDEPFFCPWDTFGVRQKFAFGKVVGETVQHVVEVLLLQTHHNLENALAYHVEESLLVVGNVRGCLVCSECFFSIVFGSSSIQAFLVIFRVRHLFPFFEQARVYAADHFAEVVLHFPKFFVLVAVRHGL